MEILLRLKGLGTLLSLWLAKFYLPPFDNGEANKLLNTELALVLSRVNLQPLVWCDVMLVLFDLYLVMDFTTSITATIGKAWFYFYIFVGIC